MASNHPTPLNHPRSVVRGNNSFGHVRRCVNRIQFHSRQRTQTEIEARLSSWLLRSTSFTFLVTKIIFVFCHTSIDLVSRDRDLKEKPEDMRRGRERERKRERERERERERGKVDERGGEGREFLRSFS